MKMFKNLKNRKKIIKKSKVYENICKPLKVYLKSTVKSLLIKFKTTPKLTYHFPAPFFSFLRSQSHFLTTYFVFVHKTPKPNKNLLSNLNTYKCHQYMVTR